MDASLMKVEKLMDASSLEVETMLDSSWWMLKLEEASMMVEHPDELEEEQLCSASDLQVGGQLAAVCPG